MNFKYYPNEETVKKSMLEDEPLLMVISFDSDVVIISPLDEAVEHHLLLSKCNISSLDIDKYFRIVFDKSGADWTFVCPPKYKNISDKKRRITSFYNDGFNAISKTLAQLNYLVGIEIPKRYRRHIEELKE